MPDWMRTVGKLLRFSLIAAIIGGIASAVFEMYNPTYITEIGSERGMKAWAPVAAFLLGASGFFVFAAIIYTFTRIIHVGFLGILLTLAAMMIFQAATGICVISFGSLSGILIPVIFWAYVIIFHAL